jgi:hypothetical protein
MRRQERDFSRDLFTQLRDLDRRLRIDHPPRGELAWLVPVLMSTGTLAIFVAVGLLFGVGFAVSVPIGVIAAVVIAGMSLAYMTPEETTDGRDDEGGSARGRQDDGWPSWISHPSARPPSAQSPDTGLEDLVGRARSREHAGRPT